MSPHLYKERKGGPATRAAMKLTLRGAFLVGVLAGDVVAAISGVIWLLPFPFSHELHVELITVGAWLCPFYLLMFMSVVHGMAAVVAIAFAGNGLLYGSIAVFARLVYGLYRKWRRLGPPVAGPPLRSL